jgi:hypothetical protein
MSDACFLKFLEIVQDSLTERPLVVAARIGMLFFQADGFRFVELAVEKISVGEVGLDYDCVIGG